MKLNRSTYARRRLLLGAGVAVVLCLVACSNTLNNRTSHATSLKGIPVTVSCTGSGSASGSRVARDLLDGSVTSVVILVYDQFGNTAYSGPTPTLIKESSYWHGNIDITATGLDVFCAYALNGAGLPLYVGKATQNITGPASITISTGTVDLEGGAIQGNTLSLSTAVTTMAGSTTSGHADGTGVAASFYCPYGITTDGTNLYVADYQNNEIRQIVIATGVVTTLAGSTTGGHADGNGPDASFYNPQGITTDGTNLYVADTSNNEIRKIQ